MTYNKKKTFCGIKRNKKEILNSILKMKRFYIFFLQKTYDVPVTIDVSFLFLLLYF